MPALAMNSAAKEPTPPIPTTIKCFFSRVRNASSPINKLVLDNHDTSFIKKNY